MKTFSHIFIIIVISLMTSCQKIKPQFENYGDIYKRNGDSFVLSQATHAEGWGRDDCFLCHNRNNIHKVDRIADLSIDLESIEEEIDRDGLDSCSSCHGNNGL